MLFTRAYLSCANEFVGCQNSVLREHVLREAVVELLLLIKLNAVLYREIVLLELRQPNHEVAWWYKKIRLRK